MRPLPKSERLHRVFQMVQKHAHTLLQFCCRTSANKLFVSSEQETTFQMHRRFVLSSDALRGRAKFAGQLAVLSRNVDKDFVVRVVKVLSIRLITLINLIDKSFVKSE